MRRQRVAVAACLAVAAVAYGLRPGGRLLEPALALLAAVVVAWNSRREGGNGGRAGLLFSATLLLWAFGDAYAAVSGSGQVASQPAIVHAAYLLGYVLAVASGVRLAGPQLARSFGSAGRVIELAVAALASLLALWEFIFDSARVAHVPDAIAGAYPFLDWTFATSLLFATAYSTVLRPRILVLAGAWLVAAGADFAYARDVLVGSTVPAGVVVGLHALAYVLFALSALVGPEPRRARESRDRPPPLASVAGVVATAAGALALIAVRPGDPDLGAGVLLLALLATARLALLLRDNERLERRNAETTSLLRGAFDATEDAVVVTDAERRPTMWNRRFEELFPRAETERALLAGDPEPVVELRLDDGRVVRRASRPQVADDRIAGRVWSFRDVTLERAAEQTLRASHDALRATLEDARLLGASFDGNLRILHCNDHFLEVTGWTREELVGRRWTEAILPDADAAAVAAAARARHETKRSDFHLNEIVDRSDNRRRIAWNSTATHDLSGNVEQITVIGFDVTPLEEAHAELERRERRMRSLLENSLELVGIADASGALVEVISAVPALREDLTGTCFWDWVEPQDAAAAEAVYARALAAPGRSIPFEFRVASPLGNAVVAGSVKNLLADPAVAGIVVNARDVTDARAAEEALALSREQLLHAQKLEAVARLAGGVAHDFNNLLTAILGYVELMRMRIDEGDELRADVEEVAAAAERAAALTRQLLAFSRRQVMELTAVDVNDVVGRMENLLRRLLGETIELVTDLDEDLAAVVADEGQLEQVLANLAVNARDAMPDGGRIEIRTRTVATPQDVDGIAAARSVSLCVADSGIGMDAETAARAFEPFFTTKPVGAGTGLGLATVHGIVAQSGGAVRVRSAPGEGTELEVLLPVATVGAEREERVATRRAAGSETILLVEDEQVVRELAYRILTGCGYDVLTVAASPDAVELCATHDGPIDLLLTDVVMPLLGGRELAARARRLRPGLPVLFMSGYTGTEVLPDPGDGGAPLLEKPFTPDALAARVREVLDAAA